MQTVTDIPGMISQPIPSQHNPIICETKKSCVDVEGSENLEMQENVEIVSQVKKIHRTGLVDVMHEDECSSPAPLQQHANDQSAGNNKSQ